MDFEEQMIEHAENCDQKQDLLENFIKTDLPSCNGYVLIYVGDDDRVAHLRWNMRPWKVRGAVSDILADLQAQDVKYEMEDD